MNTKTANEVLREVCAGRTDLLALGQRFNQEVQSHADAKNNGLSGLNEMVDAIFELEGVTLNPDEKLLVRQIDQLKWEDEQVIEFLKAMGRA